MTSSMSKSDKKKVLDFAAWSFNITTSVGIIMVNKALMATHGFSFGMFFATLRYIFCDVLFQATPCSGMTNLQYYVVLV
jgi:hypothetical protein